MQGREHVPFIWPKGVKRNEELVVLTVADEKELATALKSIPPEKQTAMVGTHSGPFHTDEVLACVLLKYTKLAPTAIIRTRSDEILAKLKVVVDVGGKFNPSDTKYDHHMRDFKGICLLLMDRDVQCEP